MKLDLDPARNRPTIGTLVVSFVTALLSWGYQHIPETVPVEVRTTGAALVIALVAYGVGQLVQHVGDRAPWADDTHRAAVAYALSLDPEAHGDELAAVLAHLGLDDLDEAARIIGLD